MEDFTVDNEAEPAKAENTSKQVVRRSTKSVTIPANGRLQSASPEGGKYQSVLPAFEEMPCRFR
ncbi:MAG TPA: hypothetical protein VK200_03675, partial [Candidatus Limnocylindrales bacterium]|nr:hypothetical protein [Candidatus Limnocylindrales bacterium]